MNWAGLTRIPSQFPQNLRGFPHSDWSKRSFSVVTISDDYKMVFSFIIQMQW